MSRKSRIYFFKVSRPVFMQLESGLRSFHVTIDDQDFKLADVGRFQEIVEKQSTGRELTKKIIGVHRKVPGVNSII